MSRYNELFARSFWRPVITLISGTGMAQLITFFAIPVMTRIYPPEDFGRLAIYLAAVVTLAVIINGGMEWPIMLPPSGKDAAQLTRLSIAIALGLSGLLALVSLGADFFLTDWPPFQRLRPWHRLLPLSLALEGIIQPLTMLLNRRQQYRAIAFSKIARSAFRVGISLTMGLMGANFAGLIWGFFTGEIACTLFLMSFWLWAKDPHPGEASHSWQSLIRQYKDFPRYAILSNGLNTFSKQLPFFLLPILFLQAGTGELVNGYFNKADQLLMVPIGLISISMGSVFYEQATRLRKTSFEAMTQYTKQTLLRLLMLGIPFMLTILLAGPWLFATFLGKAWYTSGVYAQWMAPYILLLLLVTPLSYLVDIERKLKSFLLITATIFTGRLISLLMAGQMLGPLQTIAAYSLVSIVLLGIQLGYLLWIGGVWKSQSIRGRGG